MCIICGRRNLDRSKAEEDKHLLRVFKRKAEEEKLEELVDEKSEDMVNHIEEAVKMMGVAAGCLQGDFTKRPSMSVVIKVLEGLVETETNLDYDFWNPTVATKSIVYDATTKLPPHCQGLDKIPPVLESCSEQKKQKISEVRVGLDDADALIRKMDLEARSLPPNPKSALLAKLREYKTDLNNLKTEVKRVSSANFSQAVRDDLLESGMADAMTVSADQRGRLMMSTERLNQSSDRIREGRKVMLDTEDLGVSILQDLHQQRQALLHAHNTLHGVDDNISRSKKVLTNMSRRMSRNKYIIGSIIAVLVIAIKMILYFKLTH